MSAEWKAGDKAVCVDMRRPLLGLLTQPNGLPREGNIYLVDAVQIVPEVTRGSPVSLRITGHPNIWDVNGRDVGYAENRFRKIVPACDRATQSDSLEIHQGFWDKRPDLK